MEREVGELFMKLVLIPNHAYYKILRALNCCAVCVIWHSGWGLNVHTCTQLHLVLYGRHDPTPITHTALPLVL